MIFDGEYSTDIGSRDYCGKEKLNETSQENYSIYVK